MVIQAAPHRTRVAAWALAGAGLLTLVAALVPVGLNAGRVGGGRIGSYHSATAGIPTATANPCSS